jgi:hypothetical protein
MTSEAKQSLILKEVAVTTLTSTECHGAFAPGTIKDNMMCAWDRKDGETRGDSCAGDSGGKRGKERKRNGDVSRIEHRKGPPVASDQSQ